MRDRHEKEKPAGGTAGSSEDRDDLDRSSFTKNSPDRQSENGLIARWRWIDQVAFDRDLPPSAVRVAIVVASHVNASTGTAWPSIDRLAEILGVVPNCIRKSIKGLVQGGHLDMELGGGRNAPNRYRLIAKEEHIESSKRCTAVQGYEEKPCTDVHETLHGCSRNPAQAFTKPCTGVKGNSLKNTPNENAEGTLSIERVAEVIPIDRGDERFKRTRGGGKQLSIPVEIVESTAEPRDFAAFWLVYPKKVGRLEAVAAFGEALKHAVSSEIIAGAQRYAESRLAAESDPIERERFTKSAERWLKGRHWRDEYATPRPAGLGRHAAEALAEAYGDDWEAM
ncbi:helix-turn-helix domain-containing protein [Methylocystis sp.]|uniref:helix-turn-helix domain-containing protein n=1 Tax=Methylocystis sp. TaxID=1911079 RepID=UPI003DA652AD